MQPDQPHEMRLIGYWIQSIFDTEYFAPQEFVGQTSDLDRDLIASYLDRGLVYESYRGLSWCRFFCDCDMGHREFTDGRWVWPEGLAHYVRHHNVLLPEEFVAHVRKGIPQLPRSEWKDATLDLGFWKTWCQQNQRGICRPHLESARGKAAADAQQAFADAVKTREIEQGLSEHQCLACTNRALAGIYICAACALRDQFSLHRHANADNLRQVLAVASFHTGPLTGNQSRSSH